MKYDISSTGTVNWLISEVTRYKIKSDLVLFYTLLMRIWRFRPENGSDKLASERSVRINIIPQRVPGITQPKTTKASKTPYAKHLMRDW